MRALLQQLDPDKVVAVQLVSTMIDCEWAPTAASWVLSLGPIALATGLAAYVAARSAVRLAATLAIARGRVPGHSLTWELGDQLRVTRAVRAGDGPHRTASVHGPVAELHAPSARIAWAALLLVFGVVLAAARTAALLGR